MPDLRFCIQDCVCLSDGLRTTCAGTLKMQLGVQEVFVWVMVLEQHALACWRCSWEFRRALWSPSLEGFRGKAPGNFHCFDVPACSNSAFMTRFLDWLVHRFFFFFFELKRPFFKIEFKGSTQSKGCLVIESTPVLN